MIIQDVNVLTLLSITLYFIIAVAVIIIYKAFKWPLKKFFDGLNPMSTSKKFYQINERLEDLELAKFEHQMQLKKIKKKLKPKTKKNDLPPSPAEAKQ